MYRNPSPRTLATLIALTLALMATAALAVPKTDVVTLLNGDRITCEIKEMAYGKLRAKTDDLETVSIKWNKVANLESQYWFLVTRSNGDLHYGQILESNSPLTLIVSYMDKKVELPLYDIVEIQPVRYEFWDKYDISISFGYSWTEANASQRFNFDLGTGYSGRIYSWGLDASSILSDTDSTDPYRRLDSTLFLLRQTSGDFFARINMGAQRNDELGLRLRLTAAFSYGLYMVKTNRSEWLVTAGLSANQEQGTQDEEPTVNNAELPISSQYKFFKYDSMKSDIKLSGSYIPNLTFKDRYRYEIDVSGRQEIIKDLFVELKYYISYDSNPPAGANSKTDQGVVFSVGWSK